MPDSNPDPNLGDHFGSIVSYDVTGWSTSLEPVRLVGNSGAISVQNRGLNTPECVDSGSFCPGATLTFQLGSAAPPGQFLFGGSISPNTPNGQVFFPIIDTTNPVTIKALATPVPEPGTVALLGLGLAVLAATRRRRRGPQH